MTTTWEPRVARLITLQDAEAALVADDRTLDRFFTKVAMPSSFNACWPWIGSRDVPKGYGRFSSLGRPIYAHRASYILAVEPIPAGLQIDHLCNLTCCVNPTHLEPVPGAVNILRGDSPSARNAVKTECLRGHQFDAANTGRQQSGRHKGRMCLACKRLGAER